LRSTSKLLLFLCCSPAFSQSQITPPSFEAADVKANKSGEVRMAVDFQPGGRLSARNVPLKILIALAYHVRPDAVTGGPGWLGSDRFDIVAKASQTTAPDDLRRMLQTLLAERFKLELHSEKKMMPAYSLSPAKAGARLQPAEAGLVTERRCHPGETMEGQKHLVCEHMTMALFADTLQEIASRDVDAPVVDQTGLQGAYTFSLAWTPGARTADLSNPDPPVGPTLSEALESQLGLKLENKKLPLPVMVIDRVERVPAEN
jgi:uncharacterized protein (TIGR03435 family)